MRLTNFIIWTVLAVVVVFAVGFLVEVVMPLVEDLP